MTPEEVALTEIELELLALGLEINPDNIKIMANIIMDEIDPLKSGNPRNITYITGRY